MEDFKGDELRVGDKVAFMKTIRTGSSSSRKVLFQGEVSDFTPKKVVIIPSTEGVKDYLLHDVERMQRKGPMPIVPEDVVKLNC